MEWVDFPFSRGFSQPRDWTQVSRIAGRFFTSWATGEAQEYWNGQPSPSPADLPDPGIEPGFPALQADSLPIELSNLQIYNLQFTLCLSGEKDLKMICDIAEDDGHTQQIWWVFANTVTSEHRYQSLINMGLYLSLATN